MALRMLLLFFVLKPIAVSSANILKNPDFESPPTNITTNTTTPFLLLGRNNTLPGWSFSGTVQYVTSGPNISLPGNGHAVQLGPGGKINQTFKDTGFYYYVLTFILAPASEDCYNNSTAVNVTAPGRSKVFYLERRYGREMWESHAYSLGNFADERNLINLEIQSVPTNADSNVRCWPVVDTFLISGIESPKFYGDNMVANSGFEVGPSFIRNSPEGILLDEEPDYIQSVLQQWTVLGTVKYIDSRHFSVPKEKAAVELVSGAALAPSGILTSLTLTKGSKYVMEFTMGDANDSCVGDFIVYAQVGMTIQNVTMRSNGTGTAHRHSLMFKADSGLTNISLASFNESQTSEHMLCGPVIDSVVFHSSLGLRPKLHEAVLISNVFFSLAMLLMARLFCEDYHFKR
ncbi:hypothetical protein RJ640_030834 [Escallonia rubra]|uniref:DUF642 domain-containing protein n=1 Tax=Escallonia rubra TaxID=112253 RepID=A0AA88QM73_9ASTE|nr:hypothetical protein RJ640_030834 [Escallonia rubra]